MSGFGTETTALDSTGENTPEKPFLSISSLIVGVIALAIAVYIAIAFEPKPKEEPQMEGQKEIAFGKHVKVRWGGKLVEKKEGAQLDPAQWYSLGNAAVCLLGLTLGSIAWWKEKSHALAFSGMGFCFAGLIWHYVLIGAAVGGMLVVLYIFSRFLVP
jgi:hypothetical protein